MGVVYEAEDLNLSRCVALKFLPDALARIPRRSNASSARHGRFGAEPSKYLHDLRNRRARRRSLHRHGNLDGETLKHRISAAGRSKRKKFAAGNRDANCRCARRGARRRNRSSRYQAREYFHHASAGKPKFSISDLAKLVPCPSRRRRHANGRRRGRSEHIHQPGTLSAPSRICRRSKSRAKELDARTDIFSFGAVIYEMATGTQPFQRE